MAGFDVGGDSALNQKKVEGEPSAGKDGAREPPVAGLFVQGASVRRVEDIHPLPSSGAPGVRPG